MRDEEGQSRKHARVLRKSLTRAEVILWSRLRRRNIEGLLFRRQHPIGPYIADSACMAAQLVVEVDGATHSTSAEIARDAQRDAYMIERGWRILRVLNDDVFHRLDEVMELIWNHARPPRPAAGPPPQAGEEK
jgi:very-short-patch-repair endonuclease